MTHSKLSAAQIIRKLLKAEFPGQKFSITSDHNSIRIKYVDGVSSDAVEKITNPFVMGHFNGMEDIYEYSNKNNEIPQVKYIFIDREMSLDVRAKIASENKISDPDSYIGEKQIYQHFQKMSF